MPYEISLVEASVAAGENPTIVTLGCYTLLKEKTAVGEGAAAIGHNGRLQWWMGLGYVGAMAIFLSI